ncbi:MAG TPA: TetR/AcrR family transcriptional regulator [Mycobacterium sp.]|uniref:TetR/AcrR family transcriptional regulator n=1 Tax=Mycolicibacterium sp. TaxID=2320850 RepID=UPI0025E65072|nr:TetR/AcrR family transcriptional regulator [Mycolicibacterium sp.]HPX37497.1 TetR/AcrR family transcriptional regulator [Mycobacterium sp.]HQC78280.1 TetR/AcrR family transcriptional regulator [Mycobacterium sp.]
MGEAEEPVNRLERRKQRTRSALIKAAQQLIVEGRLNVPVLEITQLADVGMGSFYNHFDSKEELFEAAVADVLDSYGAVLDSLTIGMDDPAETFAASFRLTGRFFRRRPLESLILMANWPRLITSDRGLAPRALRDIKAAVAAGRFTVDDPELALAVASGILLGLGTLLQRDTTRDDGATADAVTEDLLRMFGMSAAQAHKVCSRPLPEATL